MITKKLERQACPCSPSRYKCKITYFFSFRHGLKKMNEYLPEHNKKMNEYLPENNKKMNETSTVRYIFMNIR